MKFKNTTDVYVVAEPGPTLESLDFADYALGSWLI